MPSSNFLSFSTVLPEENIVPLPEHIFRVPEVPVPRAAKRSSLSARVLSTSFERLPEGILPLKSPVPDARGHFTPEMVQELDDEFNIDVEPPFIEFLD